MKVETQEEGLALLDSLAEQSNIGKFAPKLSFGQRCEILALSRKGCTRELLSKLYRVDRRTVTHIYNSNSPHYKNVREEELRLGRDNFITKYLTLDVQNAAFEFIEASKADTLNNKYANKKQGIHTMRNDMCDYDHRVEIRWKDNIVGENGSEPAGWYYRDLDSEWPNDWFHCGPDSMKTSQACHAAAQRDISDKL
jgi:hypothetical protein